MIDDSIILRIERIRDDVESLSGDIRRRYKQRDKPVTAGALKETAARISETWMVEVAPRDDVKAALSDGVFTDLLVEFQRLLTYSQQQAQRHKYDQVIRNILRDFRLNVVVPMKQGRATGDGGSSGLGGSDSQPPAADAAFVGHSFSKNDRDVVNAVIELLRTVGVPVVTGQKPRTNRISDKVTRRIDSCPIFVGIFTRQDRIGRKKEWTPSLWTIDEKAYAFAKGKKLVLLKEQGVSNLGGIQGDYEYIEFERDKLVDLVLSLLKLFDLRVKRLAVD